jgi:uncharacterized membrane protein
MGQQQLLLVILVIVIVGISTIVAVNVLKIGVDNSERDAVKQDLIQASSYVQEIWERPGALGGAGRDFTDSETISENDILKRLNIPGQYDNSDNPTLVTNDNGSYSISVENSTQLRITGIGNNTEEELILVVCKDEDDNWIFNISDQGPNTEGCVNNDGNQGG